MVGIGTGELVIILVVFGLVALGVAVRPKVVGADRDRHPSQPG